MSAQLAQALGLAVISIFLAPRVWLYFEGLPSHDTPVPYFQLRDIWSPQELESLRDLVKNLTLYTAADDASKATGVDILLPKLPDGSCPHKLMLPLPAGKEVCYLPQRFDLFQHHAKTGGRYGGKETVTQVRDTLTRFISYIYGDFLERPELTALFEMERYKSAAAVICGEDRLLHERLQFDASITLPGQEVAMHFDTPWFRSGADKTNTPLWLLIAMSGSNLFESDLLPHVQGVAYIHPNQSISGGGFYLYPYGPGGPVTVLPADANSAILVDGFRVMHGAERVKPGHVAPVFRQSTKLSYNNDSDEFEVRSAKKELLYSVKFHDLRVSIAWRNICFKNQEEKIEWERNRATYDYEDAMKTLEKDLRKRGRLGADEPRPPMLDFAVMVVDEYVKYPVHSIDSAWFPYNYCMLPYMADNHILKNVLQVMVDLIC